MAKKTTAPKPIAKKPAVESQLKTKAFGKLSDSKTIKGGTTDTGPNFNAKIKK